MTVFQHPWLMWQTLVTAGLVQWPAALAPVSPAYQAQASKACKAGNIKVSLPFSPPSSPLLQSPDNQDSGRGKDICIQQQQGQTFSPFADTERDQEQQ